MSSVARRSRVLRSRIAVALLSCVAPVTGLPQTPNHSYSVVLEPLLNARAWPSARIAARWRILSGATVEGDVEMSHRPHLGQASVRLGDAETMGWAVEAGRQRLSYGDERLLGANREVGPSPPGWECVRAKAARGRISAEALAAYSRFHEASLVGVFTTLAAGPASVEPYWLRKNALSPVTATGMRATGDLGLFQFNVEMVSERGPWAGHWEVVRTGGSSSLGLEWNYATANFDEFFPARLNQFGAEDPYGWTDTANAALHYKREVSSELSIAAGYRTYWTAAGAYLTGQVIGGLTYQKPRWAFTAGCGRLVATRAGHAPRWTPHASIAYRF